MVLLFRGFPNQCPSFSDPVMCSLSIFEDRLFSNLNDDFCKLYFVFKVYFCQFNALFSSFFAVYVTVACRQHILSSNIYLEDSLYLFCSCIVFYVLGVSFSSGFGVAGFWGGVWWLEIACLKLGRKG